MKDKLILFGGMFFVFFIIFLMMLTDDGVFGESIKTIMGFIIFILCIVFLIISIINKFKK